MPSGRIGNKINEAFKNIPFGESNKIPMTLLAEMYEISTKPLSQSKRFDKFSHLGVFIRRKSKEDGITYLWRT